MKNKGKAVLLLSAGILLCTGCGRRDDVYLETFSTEEAADFGSETGQEPTEAVSGFCYVYVCGAVMQPGVYALPADSRVYEAIQMAGGLSEEASRDSVNQAEAVFDGQMLKVPTAEEAQMNGTDDSDTKAGDGRININTATAAELMTLPGVGQAKADSIVAYREEHGAFSAVEEIMNVAGIKEGAFNRMKEFIKVD